MISLLSRRTGRRIAPALVAVLAMSACATTPPGTVQGALTGIGSITAQGAVSTWNVAWSRSVKGASVSYSPDGAHEGLTAMRDGQAHFAVGPTPLPEQDAASIGGVCTEKGAISLAAGIMPVGVAIKIEGVTNIVLDAPTLAGIFTGDITRWDDPRITALNAGQDFPDLGITVLLEEGPSETTRVMNDYLRSAPGLSWNPERADAWPSDVQGTSPAKAIERANKLDEDDGGLTVLEGNMIGNRFTAAQLIFDGQARKMDAAAVVEAVAAGSVTKSAQAVTQSLNSAAGYSLASVIYIHLCREYKEPALNRVVRSYGEHLLADRAQRDANIYAFTMSPKKQAINDGLALIRTIGEAQ